MESLRPNQAKSLPEVSLRLAVSPSMSNPKQVIATVIALFISHNSPSSLELNETYRFIQDGEDLELIRFSPEVRETLFQWFEDALDVIGVDKPSFDDRLEHNALVCLQIEPLQVGLELVWTLATLRFSADEGGSARGNSSERSGASRFPKTIEFTANVDILAAQVLSNESGYKRLLLKWMGFEDADADDRLESLLLRTLLVFAEPTLFQIQNDLGNVQFRQSNLYDVLVSETRGEDADSPTVILKNDKGKGPFRILKSSLDSGMNTYLQTRRNRPEVSRGDVSTQELENYNARVHQLLRWANKHAGAGSETSLKPTLDEDNEVTMNTNLPWNTIFYGVPGSGKSFSIKTLIGENDNRISRVVFHSEFTYGDFIGQILPATANDRVTYRFTPGPFSLLLKAAMEDPGHNYFLIIEEINRANAPGVFGDIFQLLDRDETGKSEYSIQNGELAQYLLGSPSEQIRLPSNFYLIATMNSSDQNVFTLDTAFQRRWAQHLVPNHVLDSAYGTETILDSTISWSLFVTAANDFMINGMSSTHISEDKQIGAYFVPRRLLEWTDPNSVDHRESAEFANSLFAETVIKYLWDDAFRYDRDLIFDSTIRTLEQAISRFNGETGNDRFKVFNEQFRNEIETVIPTSESTGNQ